MDEADTRRGWRRSTPVGQPAGDPRRRLPPRSRPRRSPPGWVRRSPPCSPARSAGSAKGRSRNCATPTTRSAPSPATSSGSTARRRRCTERRRGSGGSWRATIGRPSTASPSTATCTAWCSRSSTTSSTSPPPTSSLASRPGTTSWKVSTRCPCCARSRSGAAVGEELASTARHVRSTSAERDKALAIVRANEGVDERRSPPAAPVRRRAAEDACDDLPPACPCRRRAAQRAVRRCCRLSRHPGLTRTRSGVDGATVGRSRRRAL